MRGPRVLVVGGGHNGLVCAAYLARGGCRPLVLERRSVVGGACATEELWPGFRVSRGAYVLGLLRPRIRRDLRLDRLGLEVIPREPSSITLVPDGGSLVLGSDPGENSAAVRRFSRRDATRLPDYERFLGRVARVVESTLDSAPPEWPPRRPRDVLTWTRAAFASARLGRDLPAAARLLLGPAREVLEGWFESDVLRATLATDAIIGAWASPSSPGTGYVLLHHVMGRVAGRRGAWAYVRGGMGELSRALADAARDAGAIVRADAPVHRIHVEGGRVLGVELEGGEWVEGDAVVSSADPARTFLKLLEPGVLPEPFSRAIGRLDFRSPVVKMNLAVDGLPAFRSPEESTLPLTGTIHLGAGDLDSIDRAFGDACRDRVSRRPVVEMTIPSVLDPTLAPEGRHLISVFAQYAPSLATDDPRWPDLREKARDRILGVIEEVAPRFRDRILHEEVLLPPDLDSLFGMTGGNIFHGAMTPDRMLLLRPLAEWCRYRTPVRRLYLCGAGTHPGGGVMGACGRNAAREILADLRRGVQDRRR